MLPDLTGSIVESSTTIGSPARYDSHCVVSAWEHRLRLSPTSRTLATSKVPEPRHEHLQVREPGDDGVRVRILLIEEEPGQGDGPIEDEPVGRG